MNTPRFQPSTQRIYEPRPYGPIAGVWPQQKVGRCWHNCLLRRGFDTDEAGEAARNRFYGRQRSRKKRPYTVVRRDHMRNAHEFRRSGQWWRWQVVRVAGVMAARRRAGS